MGNFLAITASSDLTAAENLYQRALQVTQGIANTAPSHTLRNEWSLAASFPRLNSAASAIACDTGTNSWLAVIGTCFHASGNHDANFLLREFLDQGAEKLSRSLEGFFVIIAADGTTRELTVITDIVGSCHFFSRQVAGTTILSSSSLLLASLAESSLDAVSCQEFVATGIIYEDRTIYEEVKKLPAASIISFRDGKEVSKRLYWDVSALSPESIPPEAGVEALWHTLVSATARIGERFDHVLCDLTGGYDSRAVAAAFLGAGKHFATVVSGPGDAPDVVVSRGLAKKLNLEHLYRPCDEPISLEDVRTALHLTDGEYDVVEYARIARLHRELSRSFHISINGSFGEVARGYWWELLVPHTGARRRLDSRRVAERRYAWSSSEDLFRRQFRVNLVDHLTSVIDRAIAGLSCFPNTFQMDVAYLRMRMQHWQGRLASSTHRIWPCLSPFMFRSVLEVMLQMGFVTRQRSLLVRRMLSKYQPEIAAYPLEHGYPAAPVSWKNFVRFWPLLPYYGKKVVEKIQSRISIGPYTASADMSSRWLCSSEEVRELMNPQFMSTTAILEPLSLGNFIAAPEKGDFSRVAEWNRILSLEMALRSCR